MADATPTPDPTTDPLAALEAELGPKFERIVGDNAALEAHIDSLPEQIALVLDRDASVVLIGSYRHAVEEGCDDCGEYVAQSLQQVVLGLAVLIYGGFEPPSGGVSGD